MTTIVNYDQCRFINSDAVLSEIRNVRNDFATFEFSVEQNTTRWSFGANLVFEQEMIGEHQGFIEEFIVKEYIDIYHKALTSAIEKCEGFNIDLKILTGNKSSKKIQCVGCVLKNSTESSQKIVGSVLDLRQQTLVEEYFSTRISELSESNRELEEFAYIASHDLLEPLRKITTFSSRLAEKYRNILDGDGALFLERMMISAGNMRKLIDDLLEYSKVSKSMPSFENVDLNFILQMVKIDLELKIEETNAIIKSGILPNIEAIPYQMKQLFTNIINNSIKFRKPEVSPVIEIESTEIHERDDNAVCNNTNCLMYKIVITDNGIGFEDEFAARIFQVFQRLHGKAEYPGSGIGLAICKNIINNHKGLIFAENLPNRGSRFTFILPAKQKMSH